jgi:hypothetical protein
MRTLVHLLARIRLNAMTSEAFAQHAKELATPSVMVSGRVAQEPIAGY